MDKKYGRTLDAFWPVADTKIGRLGIMMAMERNYPENGRGLAMNGAEVVYRASMPAPFTENDIFEISIARALWKTTCISWLPISAVIISMPIIRSGIDAGGGQSMIVDYRGQLVGEATRYQRLNVRLGCHQYRSAASSPRVGASHELDERHPVGTCTDHL